MARAIFSHELSDPDFAWLLTSFRENNPGYVLFESSTLPLILLPESIPFGSVTALPPELVGTEEPVYGDDQDAK